MLSGTRAALRSRFGVLSEPNVGLLSTATLFNAAGNNIYSIALGWLAYEITSSPLAVGAVLGLRTLPMVFMGVVAGAVNDRMHRPNVLRLYALWYTGLSFGMTTLLYFGSVQVPHMLAYMFLVGLGFTFGPSARRAIYAESVPRNRVVDALAVDGTMFSVGHMTMPAIIGIVLATYGATTAFAIQTAVYSAMTFLSFRVSLPRRVVKPNMRVPFLNSIGQGLGYARRKPGVLRMLSLTSSLTLFGGAFAYALVPVISESVFDAGPTGIGAILAGGAAGGVVGPLALLALRNRVSSAAALSAGAAAMSAGMVAFAVAPSLWLAVVAYAIIGAAQPVQKATSDAYMQLAVDDDHRGRVGSLSQVTRGLSSMSAFLAGVTAEFFGVQIAIVAAACIAAGFAAWSLFTFKKYGVDGW